MTPATNLAESKTDTVFQSHDLREEIEEHLAKGEISPAMADLELLLTLTPDDAETWYLLAQLQRETDLTFQAEQSVDAALEANPKHLESLMLKAHLEHQQGFREEALTYYLRVVELDPKNVLARLLVGALEIELDRSESAAPLMRELCQSPHTTREEKNEARWLLGIAYGSQHRWEDASQALAQTLNDREITTASDWYRLAYAQLQAGEMYQLPNSVYQALQREADHKGATELHRLLTTSAEETVHSVGYTQPFPTVSIDRLPVPRFW